MCDWAYLQYRVAKAADHLPEWNELDTKGLHCGIVRCRVKARWAVSAVQVKTCRPGATWQCLHSCIPAARSNTEAIAALCGPCRVVYQKEAEDRGLRLTIFQI